MLLAGQGGIMGTEPIDSKEERSRTKEELCRQAHKMLQMAYVPYSHFPVGAAIECTDGAVFTGCNIENAAYTPTNCAERTAVFKAVSEGHRAFRRIAIAGSTEAFCAPCGVCRQVLQEFAPDIEVILVNSRGETMELKLPELLPHSFGPKNLA